jgi:CRP/FNR family transcriptional regulator, cyclic AMP receptor protein
MRAKIGMDRSAAGEAVGLSQSFEVDAFAARYGGVTVSRPEAGALIYSQGEPADSMYYLEAGQIQIAVVSSHGKEGILGILEPGSFFGEGTLLGSRVRCSTATSVAESVVARLERASVIHAIRQDPAFSEFFIAYALTNTARLNDNLISQLLDSSEKRLERALLLLAHYGRDGGSNVIRSVDQEVLAQIVGTTRSRVNYFMNRFRKLGYIDYDGSAIVVRGSLADAVRRDDASQASEAESADAYQLSAKRKVP